MLPAKKSEQYDKKPFPAAYLNLPSPNPPVLVLKLKHASFLLLLWTHLAISLLKIWESSTH